MNQNFKILLLLETGRGYDRQILRGISRYSKTYGPWKFYTNPNPKKIFDIAKDWRADAVICVHTQTLPFDIDRLLSLNIPAILPSDGNLKAKNVIQLVSGNIAFGKCAAEHLIDCGFKNFAFCPSVDKPWLKLRSEGFEKTVSERGFDFFLYKPPKLKKYKSWENEQLLLADWLKSLPKPIGIMTDTDERSVKVIEACKIANLSVPNEIAIIGIDNDDLICELSYRTLSSVAINAEIAGFKAAKMLSDLIRGKKPENNIVTINPIYVVTRCSTDTVAVEDQVVSNAINFIRNNSKKVLQVNDIAEATCVSRRVLYERFKKTLGLTPYEEIRRIRNKEIAKMLVETDMTISEIALTLGYNNIAHLARTFRQQMGISTRDYRKKYAKNILGI